MHVIKGDSSSNRIGAIDKLNAFIETSWRNLLQPLETLRTKYSVTTETGLILYRQAPQCIVGLDRLATLACKFDVGTLRFHEEGDVKNSEFCADVLNGFDEAVDEAAMLITDPLNIQIQQIVEKFRKTSLAEKGVACN